jgi:hypothetical protein
MRWMGCPMNRERIEQELYEVAQWLDHDNPPLLTLVILANGRGLAYPYPLLDNADKGTLEQRHAAVTLVRAFLRDFDAGLEEKLRQIVDATTTRSDNDDGE